MVLPALVRALVRVRESRLGGPLVAALLLPGSLSPLLVVLAVARPAGGGAPPGAPPAATAVGPVVAGPHGDAAPDAPPRGDAALDAPPRGDAALDAPPRGDAGAAAGYACPVLAAHDDDGTDDPARPPRPRPVDVAAALDPDLGRLYAALEEARRNADLADAIGRGEAPAPEARFLTGELLGAVLENPWVTEREAGESDALAREAAWLAGVDPTLGGVGPSVHRTWEDVRFLTGAIRWYLEGAYERARGVLAQRRQRAFVDAVRDPGVVGPPAPPAPPQAFDRARLREFAAMEGFEDLLALWD